MIIIPELPEVENVVLSLVDKLRFKTIVSCDLRLDKLVKRPDKPDGFKNNIKGLTISNLKRRGKYILFKMVNDDTSQDDYTLIVHLGMTGLLINVKEVNDIPDKYKNHLHLVLKLNDGGYLCYCDIRRFGSLRLLNKKQLDEEFKPLKHMGPEPFDDDALLLFKQNLSKKRWQNREIKLALMDQGVISGVGNIYASESLYNAGINPNRLVSKLSDDEIIKLFFEIRDILELSIKAGGTSISDYMNGDGKSGTFQNYLKVYGKKECPHGHPIIEKIIGDRNTFYCLQCQK